MFLLQKPSCWQYFCGEHLSLIGLQKQLTSFQKTIFVMRCDFGIDSHYEGSRGVSGESPIYLTILDDSRLLLAHSSQCRR
mmetsp:Transcript_17032/g.41487  ORF Transcript_17032/g.41487 Transcript_17032/m.41487 type:complete len:80 (+) Transcript_17032:100-339(+)